MGIWPPASIFEPKVNGGEYLGLLCRSKSTARATTTMKKAALFLAICGSAYVLTACGKYNYSPQLTEDQKKAKKDIYGEVGGVARQTKNTYPDDPNAATRLADVKAKLKTTKN